MAIAMATRNNGSSLKLAMSPRSRNMDDTAKDAVTNPVRVATCIRKARIADDTSRGLMGSFILLKTLSNLIAEFPITAVYIKSSN